MRLMEGRMSGAVHSAGNKGGTTLGMEMQRDIDIVEIPLEGVAAYWLSLKKLVDGKRSFKLLEEEAAYTSEPYIKYLLDIVFSLDNEHTAARLASIKRDVLLTVLCRKLDLMRMALLDVATGENPRKTLAKMTAQYANPPLNEENAFRLAQELVQHASSNGSSKDAGNVAYYNVDHKLKDDRLMVALLFYQLWSRREGKMACQPFLEHIRSSFFCDGLALVIDGFDAPFIRKRLRTHRDVILAETRVKMDMCLELSLTIRQKTLYEDVFRVARAFLI